MTEREIREAQSPVKSPPVKPSRAKPYWRVLLLIPAAAVLALGIWGQTNFEPGGTIDSIKITTKPGLVGQASEIYKMITGTPSLYLKYKTTTGEQQTQSLDDKPIGNGLIWALERQFKLGEILEVDVWDRHSIRSDKQLDHIMMQDQWFAEGQTFRIDLQGRKNEPPKWALPTIAVGATLCGLVLLRFIWDQVV